MLLYAVEQVQEQAHPRRLERVLKTMRRRQQNVGWVHVSDCIQPCDLVIGARLLGYRLPEDKVAHRLQRIFDNGHFMHMRWQNYFLSLPPSFKVEVSAVVRRWPVVGEADIVIRHKAFGHVVIELKSMNTNQFNQLKVADGDHRNQVNMYVGLGSAEQAQVWYENKDNQEVKTYCYPPGQGDFDTTMKRVLGIVEDVRKGRMPQPCGLCDLDDYIGNLEFTDERLVAMETERERWLKKNRS